MTRVFIYFSSNRTLSSKKSLLKAKKRKKNCSARGRKEGRNGVGWEEMSTSSTGQFPSQMLLREAKASCGVGRESRRQVEKVITFKNIISLGEEKIPSHKLTRHLLKESPQ